MKSFIKQLIFILCVSYVYQPVWAGCSPYIGLASINEVSKRFLFLNNSNDFIEVKKLDKNLSNSVMENWNLQICETVLGIFASCSSVLSLDDADIHGKYWVYSGSPEPSSYIDWIGGFDILLTDENGDVVDYLSVNNITFQYEACIYPYPTTATGAASTRRTFRSPDGVGDWDVPPGNSVPATEGEENDGDPPPNGAPELGFVSDVIVSQGGTAQLTMQLSATYGSDVVIDYATVNGDGIAGTDYVSTSGTVTIPAGSTSVDVSVDTLVSGNISDVYFFMTIESATNADVTDQVALITILQGVAVNHFQISHAGVGVTCEPSSIVVSARDASRQVITNYTGTLQLSTSTNNGDWSLIAGNGTLTNGASDSGTAQYEMVLADQGQVTLGLSNTNVETLNINVLDGSSISETSGAAQASDDEDLNFLQAVFRFLYDDGASETQTFPIFTSHKPILNAGINDAVLLRAISTDITTGECVSTLSGNQTLELALLCENPSACDTSSASTFLVDGNALADNTSSVASYSSHTLNFTAGTATLPSSIYQDAGSISLHARKTINGSLVVGSSNTMNFLPAGFCLEVNDADHACSGASDADYASCSVFKKAGENFSVTLTAQGWQVDGDSNFCDNNSTTLSFNHQVDLESDLVAPTGGNAGYLNPSSITLSSGESTFDLSWSEVGALNIIMGGNTYLTQTLPEVTSNTLGRFTPFEFQLSKIDDGEFNSANSGFTYTGQLTQTGDGAIGYEVLPEYEVQAMNGYATPDVIENYVADFFKNPQGDYDIDLSNLGSDGITPLTFTGVLFDADVTYQAGAHVYEMRFSTQDHFFVSRNNIAQVAPFDLDVQMTMSSFTDDDNVSGNLLTFDPVGSEIRYGRIKIDDAYGAETQFISQSLSAQFFDGRQFVINTLDNETNVNIADIYNVTVTSVGDAGDPLLTTDSSASGVLYDSGSIINGAWLFQWSPTVDSRFGEFEFQYTVPSWLTYNWDESGDDSQEDPTARVTFGRYRGHDNIIYWKEL